MQKHFFGLTIGMALCLVAGVGRGQQEGPGGVPGHQPGKAEKPKLEGKYAGLSQSKDPKTKGLVDRYQNLVKYQDWGDASGKFSTMAKYVSHDADLHKVKLAVPKGTGKDRNVKEVEVEVDKLSKVCQNRVRQIDTLQKKLDELAAAAPKGEGASQAGPGAGPEAGPPPGGPEGPGGVATSANGHSPQAGPGSPGQAEAPDPSASEPDPLGFGELPPVAVGPPAGPGIPTELPATPTGAPAGAVGAVKADPKQWKNDFASFVANISVGKDPNGQPLINWGELQDLGRMNSLVATQRVPGAAAPPEGETAQAISDRIGDVHWQLMIVKSEVGPGGVMDVQFMSVLVPKPVEIQIKLDETEDQGKWSKVAAGTVVKVTGRLAINEPNKITAKVKLADAK